MWIPEDDDDVLSSTPSWVSFPPPRGEGADVATSSRKTAAPLPPPLAKADAMRAADGVEERMWARKCPERERAVYVEEGIRMLKVTWGFGCRVRHVREEIVMPLNWDSGWVGGCGWGSWGWGLCGCDCEGEEEAEGVSMGCDAVIMVTGWGSRRRRDRRGSDRFGARDCGSGRGCSGVLESAG